MSLIFRQAWPFCDDPCCSDKKGHYVYADLCHGCGESVDDNDSNEFRHVENRSETIFLCGKCADQYENDGIYSQFWRRIL